MKIILVFLLMACLISCQRNVPRDILPPAKMEAVLWDLMQADEVVDYYLPADSSYKLLSKRQSVYQSVFGTHKISKRDFDKSYAYYLNNPKLLKTVFDSLHASAERLQRIPTAPGKVPDTSLRKENHLQQE